MPLPHDESQDETISVADMRSTLETETREIMRAADLRIRELSRLTQSYIAGEVTPAEATRAFLRHSDKWGDTFPLISRSTHNMSDEEILTAMDKAVESPSHASRVESSQQDRQSQRK